MILVVIAVLCVPWMLLVRPLILRNRMKKEAEQRALRGDLSGHEEHDDEEVGLYYSLSLTVVAFIWGNHGSPSHSHN